MIRIRDIIALIMVIMVISGCSQNLIQEKETADWPMVHKNLARTGSYGKPAVPPLQLKWKFQTDGSIFSSPAVVNGIVYFVSNDSCCYALDAKTGKLCWNQKIELTSLMFDISPIVADNVVYSGKGYALKAETGEILWHNANYNSEYSVFAINSVVYFSSVFKSGWKKLDAKTGKELLYFCTT